MSSETSPLIVHVIHSLEGGGTERTLVALLRAFDHRAFRHVVVTLREAGRLADQLPDQVACFPIASRGRSWSAGFKLARIARRLRARVIHARNVCCWADTVVCRALTPGARIVLGFHGLESGGAFSARDRLAARMAVGLGGRFASVSEAGRGMIVERLGLSPDHVVHLPNGVEVTRFADARMRERGAARAALGFAADAWVVGSVGALTPVKGFDVLLEAAARLAATCDGFRLLIVGDGPLRDTLTEEAAKLEIVDRVRFTGRREDVATLLAAMDAYVCSSRSEGMSNALLEAMSAGLPVVATSVGDHPVVIRNGVDGLLVPPNDVDSMAAALRKLINGQDLSVRLGAAARSRAEEFDFRRSVAAYERFYRRLVQVSNIVPQAPGAPAYA
ncbi:MAG: glycosyltransferase [Phycisphaerales bacterium]|nr:glycosyltransferase [Phycisphaerales bacterium]